MAGSSLGEHAVKLAKTPLGIIALFVLLAEAIAAMVVGTSSNLSESNQTILVIFITAFPVLVVGMFWHLVVHHNVKLYSPSEFPNHSDFLAANRVDPTHLLEEFKKDVIAEIERSPSDATPRLTRGDVELQASEYMKAVDFLEKHKLSEEEVQALVAFSEEELAKDQAESRYGSKVVERLSKLGLVAATGAGAAASATEVAKIIIRLLF
ncbi:hypothetical protein ACGYK5_15295 [Sulfitobacter sp. 1A16787]|uniref:hypothetical protein n=1 Tax=Sulfitobacter sp. 1A16787 TaxID=3368571 RepID=UPI003746D9DF